MSNITELKPNLPIVTIIGRPNVGKSSLFNRLIGKGKAIVSPIPGTTRDINRDICEWGKFQFLLMDTGGLEPSKKAHEIGDIERSVQKQIQLAMDNTDLIYFVVSVTDGVMNDDRKIIRQLEKIKRPFFVVVNKMDSPKLRSEGAPFYSLHKNLLFVSAQNGTGTADLLNATTDLLFQNKIMPKKQLEPDFSVAIVGKPNVGKSSLLNAILGYPRVIVSPIPHTTREPQDTLIMYQGRRILLIDTAGIRKKYKTGEDIERQSVEKSLENIKKSDISLLVLDTTTPIDQQDKKIAGQLIHEDCSLIITANKWDLAEQKQKKDPEEYQDWVLTSFPYLNWARFTWISAKTGFRTNKILDMVLEIMENREKWVQQEALSDLLGRWIEKLRRPIRMKEIPHIYGIKQKGANPPVFELTVEKREKMPKAVTHSIKNDIKETFQFEGTPIFINVRSIKK